MVNARTPPIETEIEREWNREREIGALEQSKECRRRPRRRPRRRASASSVVSSRSCPSERARPAPSARRSAISLRRSIARASRKLARLTQASSSTRPTTAESSHAAARIQRSSCGITTTSALGLSRKPPLRSQSSGWLSVEAGRHRVESALRVGEGGAGREPRLDEARVVAALLELARAAGRLELVDHHHRRVDRGADAAQPAAVLLGRDADDGVRPPADAQLATHDLGVPAERALPVAVAEHDDRVPARRDVVARAGSGGRGAVRGRAS